MQDTIHEWVLISAGPHEGATVKVVKGFTHIRIPYRRLTPQYPAACAPVVKTADFAHEYKRVDCTALADYPPRYVWLPAEWSDAAIDHWLGRLL